MYKIGISGSYGGLNLGDEAILEVMLQEIRRNIRADIIVFSRNPADTQKRHRVKSVPIRQMHRDEAFAELKKLDIFILGGGGILLEGMADQFLRDVNWAKECSVPVMVYAISVGPFSNSETKQMVRDTLNKVDKITVREPEAKKILNDIGVEQPIEVTADPAFLLQMEPFTKEMIEHQGIRLHEKTPLVGFSVREPGAAAPDLDVNKYHEVLANAADFMVERFKAQIIFVPMERRENKDLQHSHSVIAKMANAQKAQVLNEEFTPSQVMGMIKLMDFAVGMRLHFLIFAALQNVPFVPLPYASKIIGFLKALEMPMPPLKEINSGKLCAFLDRCWDTRHSIQQRLEKKIPQLQKQAGKNVEILRDFLSQVKSKSGAQDGFPLRVPIFSRIAPQGHEKGQKDKKIS